MFKIDMGRSWVNIRAATANISQEARRLSLSILSNAASPLLNLCDEGMLESITRCRSSPFLPSPLDLMDEWELKERRLCFAFRKVNRIVHVKNSRRRDGISESTNVSVHIWITLFIETKFRTRCMDHQCYSTPSQSAYIQPKLRMEYEHKALEK